MKTEWDYTSLADAYITRPDYADMAIDAMLSVARVENGSEVCDMGAGVAHLTLMLAKRHLNIVAVEPNDAMRHNGVSRTATFRNIRWAEGTGEKSNQPGKSFDLVTFGSSFNVCDRSLALIEVARILKPNGWFACMWNHRQLNDPIQAEIEAIITSRVRGYRYGARREDQTATIDASQLFGPVAQISSRIEHEQPIEACVEAWRSHATLERQAGPAFRDVIAAIADYLQNIGSRTVRVPYTTNIWMARLR